MVLSKSKIFLICCLSFITGITITSYITDYLVNYNFYFFILATIFLITSIIAWHNKKIRIASLAGIFLFLGIWRFLIGLPDQAPDKIWYYNDQKIKFTGVVSAPPDVRQSNQKLTAETSEAYLGVETRFIASKKRAISGKVLVTDNLYPTIDYGDKIKFTCKLEKPEEINGFAYDKYLARYDIYSLCYNPETELLKKNQGYKIYAAIYKLKNKLTGAINTGLQEPLAGLANAIMFGDKRGLPQALLDVFSQTGTTHIMAISGMNITIIAALSLSLMLMIGFSRRQAFYLSIILLIIFIILVGAPASAMRAGLMGFLVLLALRLGRLNKITNSTVLAAAVMLVINPKLLRYDIGFQLSFLAILGLVYCYPVINDWFDKIKIPKLKGARDILAMTLAAQVFTIPITAYNFSTVSLIAPIPNILILWIIPLLTALIFIAIFLTLIIPGWSILFFTPSWLVLKYIIIVCIVSARIPFAALKIDYFNPVWIIIYYMFFIFALVKINKRKEQYVRSPVIAPAESSVRDKIN